MNRYFDDMLDMGSRGWVVAVLALFSFIMLGSNIGGLSIYAYDEAKNAGCAREMMERADWVVPTFNGDLRTDKPPLHYYFMILGYRLFGVTPFGARFFSVLAGVATVLLTFWFARRYLGHRTAVLSAFILLSSLQYGIQYHLAVPDPYLILWLSMAFFGFYAFAHEKKTSFLWMCYGGAALGVLTKGPVALVLPGLAALIFLLSTRRLSWSLVRQYKPWWGLLLILVVNLPWYLAVHHATDGAWTRGFFLQHNLGRYTSTMEGHGGFFLLPPLFLIAALLPFSIFVIQAAGHALREKPRALLFYGLVTALAVAGFFSLSQTKLLNYISPGMPFLAIVLAGALSGSRRTPGRWDKVCAWLYAFIAMLIPIGLYIALITEEGLDHLRFWALLALPLPLAAIMGLRKLYYGELGSWIMLNGLAFMLFSLLFFYVLYPRVDRTNVVLRGLGHLDTSREIIAYGNLNPAFVFYLPRCVQVFSEAGVLREHMQKSSDDLYLITTGRHRQVVEEMECLELLFSGKDLFESPVNLIYRRRCAEPTDH